MVCRLFTKKDFRTFRQYHRDTTTMDGRHFLKVMRKYHQGAEWLELMQLVVQLCEETALTERQARIKRLASKYSGRVYYHFWGIDCDLCESSYAYTFENEFYAQNYIDDFYDNAEGRCSVSRMTKEEYEQFESYSRDHAAERMGY